MKFEAILFDCDGVLVDSETITHQVLRQKLGESGWQLSLAECMRIFIGKMVRDEAALIERMTGQQITNAWMDDFRARRNEALERELEAIPGAAAAVATLHAASGGRIACASGADRPKIELQLRKVGLLELFAVGVRRTHLDGRVQAPAGGLRPVVTSDAAATRRSGWPGE